MTSPPIVQYASRTDVGMRRSGNQDSLAVRLCSDSEEWSICGHLFVVADGMGGHAVGDLASRIAVETLPLAYFKREAPTIEVRIRQAVLAANKAINDRARQNPEFSGMGTTCSVLSLSAEGAIVGHVGDSRVYRVHNNQIEQLTFDHSLQWEMIRIGRATAENVELFHPRNVITRCLGPDPAVQVDTEGPFRVSIGDRFVLCSDGLTNHVADTEIGQIVASLPPVESARLLVNLANCRGGSDNCTVVVVEVESYPNTSSPSQVREESSPQPQETPSTSKDGNHRGENGRLLLAAVAVICLLSGIGLVVANQLLPGILLMIASVLAWLISRRIAANRPLNFHPFNTTPALGSPDIDLEAPTAALADTVLQTPPNCFHPKSPYRVLDATLSESLLVDLAKVHGELFEEARNGGWNVDFGELTNLGRQAMLAQQNEHIDRVIRTRAKAIDLLMREFYQRSRSNNDPFE